MPTSSLPLLDSSPPAVEPAAVPRSALARITDPRRVPVAGHDAHLPPLPAERLQPAWLRGRFAAHTRSGEAWQPDFPGDGGRSGASFGAALGVTRGPTAASVLIPLVERADGLHVLLTQRTDTLRDHAGQVSFPGGRAEPEDADAVATALRETAEETGLAATHIEVLGHLPVYTTVTNYLVTPVVALVRPPFTLALDAREVAEAFEVPLPWLMTPAHHRHHVFQFDGGRRSFLSMPWQRPADGREFFIWGATAAMLRNLYGYLAAAPG